MTPIKTILVSTDFSQNSMAGVDYARDLARQLGSRLVLFHVSPSAERLVLYGPAPAHVPRDLEAAIEQGVEKGFADVLQRFDESDKVTPEHRRGDPYAELVAYAESQGIDMIVMATHGHTGLKHLMLGSVAERVVRTAPCPVLTVRSST